MFKKQTDQTSNTRKAVRVGIWGPTGVGKTSYILGLHFADDNAGWSIRPAHPEALTFYIEGVDMLRKRLTFPPASPTGDPTAYHFELEKPPGWVGRREVFTIVLPEAAGEDYEQATDELLREYHLCQGIIWLIDPQYNPPPDKKGYTRLLQEWLGLLHLRQGGGRIEKFMAFCVTKMDHPNSYPFIADPAKYCEKLLGEDFYIALEKYCREDRIRFFAISVAGVNPRTGESNAEINVVHSGSKKLKRPAEPINLYQPLLWLVNQIKSTR